MELQWPLILFTTILAWSAGLFGTQAVYVLRGEGTKSQMTALITSVVLLAVSGISVFMHLQHWERIFNGFGHITSGITQEFIAIIAIGIVMVLYFVFLRRNDEVPKWLAWLALAVSVILVCVCGHSYMMPSRPAWDSVLQVASLLGAACALGPATMAVICDIKQESAEYNGKINVIGQIIGAVITVIYVGVLAMTTSATTKVDYWFDPVSPTRSITENVTLSPFSGDCLAFTAVAIIGVIVAVAVAFIGKKQGKNWKLYGGIAVVAGVLAAGALRCAMYVMGISVYPFF